MTRDPVVVLGGGLAGLSAAYHLGGAVPLVERAPAVGGLCRSRRVGGFTFDAGGHVLHFRREVVEALVRTLLDGAVLTHERRASVYSQGCRTPYPFQGHLYGRPPEVVAACVEGFLEAWARRGTSGGAEARAPAENFADWATRTFGAGIVQHFLRPYNTKLWTVPPEELACDWVEGFIPIPTPEQVLGGAASARDTVFGYNATFLYPASGAIEEVAAGFARRLQDIRVQQDVRVVDLDRRVLEVTGGAMVAFDQLVSSIPLPVLCRLVRALPARVEAAVRRLRHTSLAVVSLGVKRPDLGDQHWVYFPDAEQSFFRIGFPGNFCPRMVPPGCSSVYAEIAFPPGRSPGDGLVDHVVQDLLTVGVLRPTDEILLSDVQIVPYGYPIHDHARPESVALILDWLQARGVLGIGRFGRWAYLSMEGAILDGRQAAALVGGRPVEAGALVGVEGLR